MSTIDPIKVDGLIQFQRALKQMDGESQKQLRVVLNSAADLVVATASRRIPRRSGKAAASIRAMSSQREAKVMGGSKKVPYVGWLEFGGRVGQKHATQRPYIHGGRYIYPGYTANRPEVQEVLARGLADLVRQAGLEVT